MCIADVVGRYSWIVEVFYLFQIRLSSFFVTTKQIVQSYKNIES